MRLLRPLALFAAIAASAVLLAQSADAQSRKPEPNRAQQAQSPAPAAMAIAAVEQKCLRALNGACTNPGAVEAARQRAMIIPAVRVSYLGTPAGTIGGSYIPFERAFQDNPFLFGLPTFIFVQPCCTTRSK